MEPDFSGIYHQSSKNLFKGPHIPLDPAEWPQEWRTIYYKTYPRMRHIALPQNTPPSSDFFSLIRRRSSQRDFKKTPIELSDLSLLLTFSCGITAALDDTSFRRAQPSGGARFPIEVYLLMFLPADGLASGVYHYDVKAHALDRLEERLWDEADFNKLFTYPWVKNASAALILTGVFWRTQNKYSERGYRYVLIEAGHIGQNVYLAAEALGLKCSALAGTRDEKVEKLLDIDGITESLVYALILGR